MDYLRRIYETRYFWWHLTRADLRQRYRRSALGMAWAILQPLGMTLLITFVMAHLFKSPIGSYAPYVFSGLVVWEYIGNATIGGCHTFINAGMYIRQFSHPYIIYTLRHTLGGLINFMIAFVGVALWGLLLNPENFGACWLSLPLAFLLLFLFAWALSTICAFIATWFHDFSQMIVLLLQALYFVSPVFIQPSMFRNANMGFLVDDNPFYHLFELFRAPVLTGMWPTSTNFIFSVVSVAVIWLMAALLIRYKEKNLIFYC